MIQSTINTHESYATRGIKRQHKAYIYRLQHKAESTQSQLHRMDLSSLLRNLPGGPPPTRIPRNLLLGMSNELQIYILGHVDRVSQINLAVAFPERYLSDDLNIYVLDAHFQVRLQDIPPLEESDATIPLLIHAIRNRFHVDVIRQIITIYEQVVTDPDHRGIDSIWGPLSREIPTPLHEAIRTNRLDVVDLILQHSANPRVRFQTLLNTPRSNAPEICNRVGFPHFRCTNLSGQDNCKNALRYALWRSYTIHGPGPSSQAKAVAIIRRLFESGESIEIFDNAGNVTVDFREVAIKNLSDVIIGIINGIINLPNTDPRKIRLSFGVNTLLRVILFGDFIPDGQDVLIAYFIRLGANPTLNMITQSRQMERVLNAAALARAITGTP